MQLRPWWLNTDDNVAALLHGLPSLQQLQSVELNVPAFGTSCAGHVAQLVQLTELSLSSKEAATHAAADLVALSSLTRLVRMRVWEPPAVQLAAAGAACIPSSLTHLYINDGWARVSSGGVSPMSYWVTHLPGCPQLRWLELLYIERQHSGAHPSNLIQICAQHNRQLCVLKLGRGPIAGGRPIRWSFDLPDLPAAPVAQQAVWHPDAALASLTGLQCLHALGVLHISTPADWQQLTRLTALTELGGVHIHCVPLQQVAAPLRLLALENSRVHLGGHELAQLALALPSLEGMSITISEPIPPAAVQPAGMQLARHPRLRKVQLEGCCVWGDAAAAAAEFDPLGVVLSGVSELVLRGWPPGFSMEGGAGRGLPDLSACTGLVALEFGCTIAGAPYMYMSSPGQEQFVSMLAPLVQLTSLHVCRARGMNMQAVLELQFTLSRLQCVNLQGCGERRLPPDPYAAAVLINRPSQREGDLVQEVMRMQLLRPGLKVRVT
jgi:hypothetical protein